MILFNRTSITLLPFIALDNLKCFWSHNLKGSGFPYSAISSLFLCPKRPLSQEILCFFVCFNAWPVVFNFFFLKKFKLIYFNWRLITLHHNKLWKILKEKGIPDHLTCLLRNLYAGQEATVRTGHGTTDWFQIGKGVCQGCIIVTLLI